MIIIAQGEQEESQERLIDVPEVLLIEQGRRMTAVTDEMRCQQHEQRQWNEPFGLSSGDVKCQGEKKL